MNKREIDESKLLGKRGASSYLIYAVSVLFCVHGKRKSQIKIDFTKAKSQIMMDIMITGGHARDGVD